MGTFTNLGNSLSKFSYQSILKATNSFSSSTLVGSGTFGVVYKGVFDHDNQRVFGTKVFNLENHGASRSFMAECEVLRNIRHRNLVKVITACSSIEYQGNAFKALVYEYMVNGNLDDWLYPVESLTRRLNLYQRLDIVVDVASVVEYLHHRCGTPIVHCDLKPSNLLLDREMVAHVSDFGLAKFLAKDISTESTSFGFRGTIGYAPPGK